MRVANPIYDVVFKYLIGDMKIAKLILSSILETEIEELEFAPTELQTKIKNDRYFDTAHFSPLSNRG